MSWYGVVEGNAGFTGTLRAFEYDENGSKDYLDVSGYDAYTFYLTPPDGSAAKTVTASVKTDGQDGRVSALIAAGVIHVHGKWRVACNMVKTGADLMTLPEEFDVSRRPA